MAETFWQKLRDFTLGNAHALLDMAIDINSPAVIKQHIRNLENATTGLEGEASVAEGNMTTENDKLVVLDAQIKELDANINFILGDGDDSNDHLAEPLQARLMALEGRRKPLADDIAGYKSTMDALDHTVSALKAKSEAMKGQLGFIEQQSHSAKFKDKAASAIEAASRLTAGSSVDNVTDRVILQHNISDARLKRAMGGMETGLSEDALLGDVKTQLAIRKAKLRQQAQAATGVDDQARAC
jgi:phage shock protein A